MIGLTGALGGAIIGAALGCLGGYFGGLLDRFLLRLSELFTTFPQTILVLILVAFMGQGVWNLFIVFWCTGWMGTYRMTRAKILSLREETYVLACQAFGISNRSIMFRHILPNAAGPVIVNITLSTAGYVLQESALSFLGPWAFRQVHRLGAIFLTLPRRWMLCRPIRGSGLRLASQSACSF